MQLLSIVSHPIRVERSGLDRLLCLTVCCSLRMESDVRGSLVPAHKNTKLVSASRIRESSTRRQPSNIRYDTGLVCIFCTV